MNKKSLAEEKVYYGRMIKDFCLYTAQEVFDNKLEKEEFVDSEIKWSLKFVAPYDRQGRTDKENNGADKPRVQVSAFFRKKISLQDHHELYGVNAELKGIEHRLHQHDSEWHDLWKERVKDFCDLEKRFYPDGNPQNKGYRIADAYYKDTNTVIEFQKCFDDGALDKSSFYRKENMHLIWVFYLQTLEVFEDDDKYKIREDNFFHFFRINDSQPDFYKDNLVFIQDKKDRIYYVEQLKRVESTSELKPSVRYFNRKEYYRAPEEFVNWLQYDWQKSEFYKKYDSNDKMKSLDEILSLFLDSPDKMFYLQNVTKNDINGNSLVYCFVKDATGYRYRDSSYISYRCTKDQYGYYHVNKCWNETIHYPTTKKWILLATNSKRYAEELLIENNNN